MKSFFRLDGRVAVVTGAGSGIGEAIAQRFAMAGAKVYVLDIQANQGKAVEKRIQDEGGTAQFKALDVGDLVATKAVAQEILTETKNQVDILVNNAGVGHVGTILTTSESDMDRLYRINVKGPYFLSQCILPSMIARKFGSIINLASVGGVVGLRDRFAYSTTKFAVVGMTKCMALDHAESGVRVNCLCPGRVETPFVQSRLKEYPDPEKAYRDMCASQALGRMGKPEEIAAAAHYLACDESSFVTGSAFIIDGGLSAGK